MNNQHNNVHSWRRWLFIAFPLLAAVIFALALTLPALAAVIFALALTLPALAATIYNITFPVSLPVTNPCNGENVTLSGNEHGSFHLTYDDSGGGHVDVYLNLEDVTGVGDQGNTYHAPAAGHDEYNVEAGDEGYDVNANFRLVESV